jgi:hypothetical protein
MRVIVPCGAKKAASPAPARELYRGSYFRACWAWAASVAELADIRILSALYGLVEPDQVLAPYNVRMGAPGAIALEALARQAAALGWTGPVAVLGAADYVRAAEAVFPGARSLVPVMRAEAGGVGLGHQIGWLRRNAVRIPAEVAA